MIKKPITYFLCVLTLALIAVSPLIINSFFAEPQQNENFEGILELWHISDWRTGGSSKSAFLLKRIKEFEKSHPHVFVRMTKMSVDEAFRELDKGIYPDVMSYPSSIKSDYDSESAYMYGAYYIIVNNEVAEENGIFLPDGCGMYPDMLKDLFELGLVFDAEDGYSALPVLALHEYPESDSPDESAWPGKSDTDAALNVCPNGYYDGTETFLDGQVCVLIASQRQLFEVANEYEQNNGPAFSYFAVSGYTDMAQYVCVFPGGDALRLNMSLAFADYLVSERAQSKLYALGVFPASSGIKIYEDDGANQKIYELLQKKPAIVSPDIQDTLTDLSLRSFSGDRTALKQLRRLLE